MSLFLKIKIEAGHLWHLAWPVLIGQLASVGMGVADVAMTGHASPQDLAAVSLGAALWAIFVVTVIGLMLAMNALIAHEVGAGNMPRIAHLVRQSLWMALGVGLVSCALLNASVGVFDYLHLDAAVQAKATRFVRVVSIGLPAFAAYRALYGYSAGLNHTRPMMVFAVGALLYNIVINSLFVYGLFGLPKLGAVGCAIGTGSGMWLMFLAMVWWISRAPGYRQSYPFAQWEWPNRSEIALMLKQGIPIGVTYLAEVSAFSAVGLLVARFGVVTLSAHQIALNFSSLVFMVPLSFGIGMITRIGQAMGEQAPKRARFSAQVGVGMALAFGALSALFICVFREWIAAAYSSDPAVQDLTRQLLILTAVFQLSDATQTAAASAIRGYKVTQPPMIIHLIAFWVVSLPLGCVLGLMPQVVAYLGLAAEWSGIKGFWIGLVFGLTTAAVALVWLLNRLSRQRVQALA